MNHTTNRLGLALLALGAGIAVTTHAQAGHRDPLEIACRLERAAASLESELLHHFQPDPCFPEHMQQASQLRANACYARTLLERGALASDVRPLVSCMERDANRLENCLEDINYKRLCIPKECYRQAVNLADDCEDLSDDLGDELEDYGCRPVVSVRYSLPIVSQPRYYEQAVPVAPVPLEQENLRPLPSYPEPRPNIDEPILPAPPLPQPDAGQAQRRRDMTVTPASYEVIDNPPRPGVFPDPRRREVEQRPVQKVRPTRELRIGPLRITF